MSPGLRRLREDLNKSGSVSVGAYSAPTFGLERRLAALGAMPAGSDPAPAAKKPQVFLGFLAFLGPADQMHVKHGSSHCWSASPLGALFMKADRWQS